MVWSAALRGGSRSDGEVYAMKIAGQGSGLGLVHPMRVRLICWPYVEYLGYEQS